MYLHDPDTRLLYSRPATASEWPVPVGRVAAGRAVLYAESADAIEFFRVGASEQGPVTDAWAQPSSFQCT